MLSHSETSILQNQNRPIYIALEGMHRSGKGTQLALLKAWLDSEYIQALRVRGAACRSGKGVENQNYHDPESSYWQKFSRDRSNGCEDWTHAFVNIDNEVREFGGSFAGDVVLMDRSYTLSGDFFREKFNALSVNNPFEPDVVYYLNVQQSTLLERLGSENDWKSRFRRNNILEYYTDFSSFVEEKKKSSDIIVEVDGSLGTEDVFGIIQSDLRERFAGVFTNS